MNRQRIPWIAVDLDGTLAEYHGWGDGKIGKPVPLMMNRVKEWLAEGNVIKIFTARVAFDDSQVPEIHEWLERHGLPKLEITAIKDYDMIMLYDDRCTQIVTNTGIPAVDYYTEVRGQLSNKYLRDKDRGEIA